VDDDRGERHARGDPRPPGERGPVGASAQGQEERAADEPEEEGEPNDAGLGGEGEGRRVRDAALGLAVETEAVGVRVAETADADAEHRVVGRDPEPVLDDPQPPARRPVERALVLTRDRVTDAVEARRREPDEEHDDGERPDSESGAPAPREGGGQRDARDQCHEARL
jgi:hypothetical protein